MQLVFLILFHYLSVSYCSNLFGLNLHHTNRVLNGIYRDCLYYNVPERGLVSQLIQYCIRSEPDDEVTNLADRHRSFTFEDLRKNNVTSFQLYTWAAPIDLAEDYEIYLKNVSSTNTFWYYNCTYPWFGPRCGYTFDYPSLSFARQVEMKFDAKARIQKGSPSQHFPCYIHLKCNRVSNNGKTTGACLDWHEICDGKVDCIDGGHDEEQCSQLEINECDSETEFRCHIGLCIPLVFLNDDEQNADCLDRTDEPYVGYNGNFLDGSVYLGVDCNADPASRCEDHMCRPFRDNTYTLDCGDGSYTNPFLAECVNMRSLMLIDAFFAEMNVSDECRSTLYCIMQSQMWWIDIYPTDTGCDSNKYSLYATLVEEHCPPLIELPPILLGHIHFVYTNGHFLVSKLFLKICAF